MAVLWVTDKHEQICTAIIHQQPIPVVARSKAWLCVHSFAEIAGSNPSGGIAAFLFECCVLSSRGLCVGLITHPECGMSDCDREASIMRRPWPHWGLLRNWEKL